MNAMRIIVVLGVVLVAATACGRKKEPPKSLGERMAEKIAEKAMEAQSGGKAKVDLSSGKIQVETAEGKIEVAGADGGVKLPADFPRDVAVYKGAQVKQTIKTDKMVSLILASKDSLADIADYYGQAMKDGGWKEEVQTKTAEMAIFGFSKDAKRANISISESGDERMISVAVETGQ